MAPTQMKLRVRRRGPAGGDAAAEGSRPEEEEEEEEEEAARARPRGGRRKRSGSRASPAHAHASPAPPGSSSLPALAEDASPDSKCPICLDRFNNLAYLDRCLHRFCFPCIQEWSHNKAECPLCKQPFASILHSVRAEDDFKEYTLQPAPGGGSVAATVAMVAAMASAARSNHQMRLMLRRHRGAHGQERRRRRERRRRPGGRSRESVAVGRWYLDPSPPPLPASPALADRAAPAAGPDGGVIFEGMMRLGGAVVPPASGSRHSRRVMQQLAARRRLQQESGHARQARERETVAFRRNLYRCGVRVAGVAGAALPGRAQPQHDVSAEGLRRNPELLRRLGPWLRRELTVLYGAHGSLVDIIQRIVMARLARHGLEDTPTIQEELRPFLLARTDHFLHELLSFARCPLSLERYDLQALYEPPAAAAAPPEAISSSSDRESVIAISEGEEEQRRPGGAGGLLLQSGGSLSPSAWEQQTPGPSSSTAAEPSRSLSSLSFSPAPQEAANEEREEEECLIVGYKKPIAERTPELVQLSSDSEEEQRQEEQPQEEERLPPSRTLTPPHLPVTPPSTSGRPEELKEEEECPGRSRSSPSGPQQEQEQGEEQGEERRSAAPPGRCIRSPSPPRSGAESSPAQSSWENSCSQVSSLSSPSHLSWCSSPPRSPPPPPSAPPGEGGEKPGGKRKYKSRHLDSSREEPSWGRSRSSRSSRRRSRLRRSPSVEIIYEGPGAPPPPARKRRRKQEAGSRAGSRPLVITLDSDSSQDGGGALLPRQSPEAESGAPLWELEPRPPQDASDHEVDVETLEGCGFLLGPEEGGRAELFQLGGRSPAAVLGDLQQGRGLPARWDGRSSGGSGLPPLLRQVSPVRSYSRNTPPPLRRSDAASPRRSHDRAAAATAPTHRPLCPPGAVAQSPSGEAPSPSTSIEPRKERCSAAEEAPGLGGPSGLRQHFLEDFGPSGGTSEGASPGLAHSTASPGLGRCISAAAAGGGGHQEPPPPPLLSSLWRRGVGGAAPPSNLPPPASDLLLESLQEPPSSSH